METDSTSSKVTKLNWNSLDEAKESFYKKETEYKTVLTEKGLVHLLSEEDSNEMMGARPELPDPATEKQQQTHEKRMDLWNKKLASINQDSMKAMGTLLTMFEAECIVHNDLEEWFNEDLDPAVVAAENLKRKDYKFRNSWLKFHEKYEPNQEVNRDETLKKLEALTDKDITFTEFDAKFQRYCVQLEKMGMKVSDEKKYEILRTNVTNPELKHLVRELSRPDAKRIQLSEFFEECIFYLRYNPSMENVKRKADAVVGRTVTVVEDSGGAKRQKRDKKASGGGAGAKTRAYDPDYKPTCWRCGRVGHRSEQYGEVVCSESTCVNCKASIGTKNHDARNCKTSSSSTDGWNKSKKAGDAKKPYEKKKVGWAKKTDDHEGVKGLTAAMALINGYLSNVTSSSSSSSSSKGGSKGSSSST